ncbi:MAG: hypothetical protein ACREFL_15465 [Stellaceae bacterium]
MMGGLRRSCAGTAPRWRNRGRVRCLVFAAMLLAQTARAAEPAVVDLPIEGGVSERVLYLAPDNPKLALVMLPGGDGVLAIAPDGKIGKGGNFLVRTRKAWVARGAAVAIPDAPSDGKSLFFLRHSPFYAQAVHIIVEFLHGRTRAPVWLVGTSQGTNAAVNAAAALTHGEIAGIVLTSSLTRAGRRPELQETVYGADLAAINVPVLIASHVDDACNLSPPTENAKLRSMLTHSPRSEIITVSGGLPPRSQPCEAFAPHGFYGVEDDIVRRILAWIGV